MPMVDQNATVYRGGSYTITVPLVDEAGEPFDPTGIDLFYRIARTVNDRTAEKELERPTITNDEDEVTIPLVTATTEDLTSSAYYHELYMVVSGERHVLMTGTLTVTPAQAARHSA